MVSVRERWSKPSVKATSTSLRCLRPSTLPSDPSAKPSTRVIFSEASKSQKRASAGVSMIRKYHVWRGHFGDPFTCRESVISVSVVWRGDVSKRAWSLGPVTQGSSHRRDHDQRRMNISGSRGNNPHWKPWYGLAETRARKPTTRTIMSITSVTRALG